jgi:hypothetical protein
MRCAGCARALRSVGLSTSVLLYDVFVVVDVVVVVVVVVVVAVYNVDDDDVVVGAFVLTIVVVVDCLKRHVDAAMADPQCVEVACPLATKADDKRSKSPLSLSLSLVTRLFVENNDDDDDNDGDDYVSNCVVAQWTLRLLLGTTTTTTTNIY